MIENRLVVVAGLLFLTLIIAGILARYAIELDNQKCRNYCESKGLAYHKVEDGCWCGKILPNGTIVWSKIEEEWWE